MDQFLHVFSVNLGVILSKFFLQKYFVLCMREVCKRFFTEIKKIKAVFNFFVFCLLQNLCLPILTIILQVNSYQINFIWKVCHDLVIFSRNANKVDFNLTNGHSDTLLKIIFINIYFMRNKKVAR